MDEATAGEAGRAPVDGDAEPATATLAAAPAWQHAPRMNPGPTGAPAEPVTPATIGSARNPSAGPWMGDQANLRKTLQDIKAGFVDDPGGSVRRAAELAESTVEILFERVRQHTRDLRTSWDGREASREPDTETLRNVLVSYRVFIDHLTGV